MDQKASTMLAAVFEGNGVLNVKEVPKPRVVKPDDVLIKVGAASICGSDLHILHVPPGQYAKPGTILGHEYFGYVEEIGSGVIHYKPGDTVVVDNLQKCHVCGPCLEGHDNLCPNVVVYGQTIDGGFSQYCVVKESQLLPIPETVPSYLAAQTEPLACVMNGMKKIHPIPTDHVAIFGMGPIGLTFIRVMKAYGVKHVAACEMSEIRRKKALECGADLAIDLSTQDVETELRKAWGNTCDIIVDAVGVGSVFSQAVNLLKMGGRLLIFGQNANAISQVPPAVIVRNELTIMGTYCPHHTFPLAIQMLQDPSLELERIISHKIALEDIKQGIELLETQQASRVIVYPNGFPE
ncbi:MAG: alcohol dehydrogenase catalytic domain-containing protein [Eubacteriales bacterium]|nr:alcohol dehydrogenase catalytic domain-containing protein [Eubacteriales bacterium]